MSETEWANLRYPVTIQKLSEEEGGGYLAWIPALGAAFCRYDGLTPSDTLDGLEELRRSLYADVIASGQPIPIPE